MNKIFAIAAITVRSAIRSRVVLVLLGLLLFAIVGLPLTVEGDGTPGGYVRVFLTYTLGAVSLILSLATLWAGCAAVADEIAERQLQMVVTKPVSLFHVWLGKWAGLMALNVFLLAVSGVVVGALLYWNIDRSDLSEADRETLRAQVLLSLRPHLPALPDIEAEAQARLPEVKASLGPDATVSDRELLRQVRLMLKRRAFTVAPNTTVSFRFSLPDQLPANQPLYLDYQFAASDPTPTLVPHRWRVRRAEGDRFAELRTEVMSGLRHRVDLDPAPLAGQGPVTVEFRNSFDGPVSVLFEPEDGLILYTYAGGFAGNLVRALLIQLMQLGLLAAVGVTAGSLFSLPVAAFVSLFVILMLATAPYVRGLAEREVFVAITEEPSLAARAVDAALAYSFQLMYQTLAPLRDMQPFEDLSVGRHVPWSGVVRVFSIRILLYSGLIGFLGSLLFMRREIGAAS